MKLIGLKINNLRRISAIEMEIKESGMTEIRGHNRQGKTTVLDAVEVLLKGKKFISQDMIQHGKDIATIKGTLKDGDDVYTVERDIRDGKAPILRLKKNGSPVKSSPETFLSSLVNDITFNPRPFMDKSDLEKQKFMMKVAGIDFTELDKQIDGLYDERKIVGREVKNYGEIVIPEKVETRSAKELFAERAEAGEAMQDFIETDGKLQGLVADRAAAEERIAELQAEIVRQHDIINELSPHIDKGTKVVAKKQAKVAALRTQKQIETDIANLEEHNVKAAAYNQTIEKAKERDAKQARYNELTEKIEGIRKDKIKQLTAAKLPVPGMVLKEDGIYLNGTHSSNWSESESMRASADLCLNMNSDLRAIFIDRGEAYDSASLQDLNHWAEKNDLQAIITIVSDIPDAGDRDANVYYIEEGARVE